jgi:phthalate 4,5-cis-dihydrodiol dehydrogenase
MSRRVILIRVAMVGCGDHAANVLLPSAVGTGLCTLVAACDTVAARAEAVRQAVGMSGSYSSWSTMLEECNPDAVIVAGPPQLHEEVVAFCLRHDTDVFVEKPPALSTAVLRQLSQLAATRGRIAVVGHNLRHAQAWKVVTSWCREAEFGEIAAIDLSYLANGPRGRRWGLDSPLRSLLLGHATHALDLIVALLGRPLSVRATATGTSDEGLVVTTTLGYERSRFARVLISTAAPRFKISGQLIGTNAKVIALESLDRVTFDAGAQTAPAGPRYAAVWQPRALESFEELAGYREELRAFFAAVQSRSGPSPSLADSVDVYEIVDQIEASVERGGQ